MNLTEQTAFNCQLHEQDVIDINNTNNNVWLSDHML